MSLVGIGSQLYAKMIPGISSRRGLEMGLLKKWARNGPLMPYSPRSYLAMLYNVVYYPNIHQNYTPAYDEKSAVHFCGMSDSTVQLYDTTTGMH
jgi:hypothetical protein